MAAKTTRKWTAAQVKEQVAKIQKAIDKQRRLVPKGNVFISITPEEIKKKLKRMNSPIILWETWIDSAPPGGTINYSVGIYNPDSTESVHLFAHVWVGSGNIDPTTGTFLLNVDTRFPRLGQPAFPGLTLAAGASTSLSFALKVPTGVEKTRYLGNTCLMQVNYLDVGKYLDRGAFNFGVT